MTSDGKKEAFMAPVLAIAQRMPHLDTGQLAELRRMSVGGPGCAAFWDLAAKAGILDAARLDPWMHLCKILALLTPKGDRGRGLPLHDRNRPFGAVLCDGGDPGWRSDHRPPFLSEPRLARLLAQPRDQRGAALERIARALANRISPGSGIDCVGIAALLFFDRDQTGQDLARAYYRRLDRTGSPAPSEENEA